MPKLDSTELKTLADLEAEVQLRQAALEGALRLLSAQYGISGRAVVDLATGEIRNENELTHEPDPRQ